MSALLLLSFLNFREETRTKQAREGPPLASCMDTHVYTTQNTQTQPPQTSHRQTVHEKKKQKPQTTRADMASNNDTLSDSLRGDEREAVLQHVDVEGLRQLKAVSVEWRADVRRELCSRLWVRLSRCKGQPEPTGLDNITDLDVKCLKPWEVVIAGRPLLQLARLLKLRL